jgi:hypothetical protein
MKMILSFSGRGESSGLLFVPAVAFSSAAARNILRHLGMCAASLVDVI